MAGYTFTLARLILRQMSPEERLLAGIVLWLMIAATVFVVVSLVGWL